MVYNESIKLSIYKWRNAHRAEYNAYIAPIARAYKEKNREKVNNVEKLRHRYKSEAKKFRNILFDDILQ